MFAKRGEKIDAPEDFPYLILPEICYCKKLILQNFWENGKVDSNKVPNGQKQFISLSRDFGKMSGENTHLECKFLGNERPRMNQRFGRMMSFPHEC